MEDTVYENLCFFGECKGLSESRIDLEIDALMIKFGLKPFMYTLASKLSGGALRKLNIAIALLNSPRVLILDEPTSGRVLLSTSHTYILHTGLDPISRREFWEVLEMLRQEKKSIILTTQFFDEAKLLADRLLVLSTGIDCILFNKLKQYRKDDCYGHSGQCEETVRRGTYSKYPSQVSLSAD